MMHGLQIKGVATLVALLFFITSFGQDTAKINALYRDGQRLILKTGYEKQDMDSAWTIARQIDALSRKMNYQGGIGIGKLLTAKILNESHRDDGRRATSMEAYNILRQYGTPRLQAEALIEIGGTFQNKSSDLPAKIHYYEAAVDIYRSIHDYLSAASMLEFVGDLYSVNGEYTKSLQTLQTALQLYNKVHFIRLHGLYSLMGNTYTFLNDFPNALRYNLMAMQTGEQVHETGIIMSPIYNRLGMIYYTIDEYEQALEYFNRGLIIAYLNSDTNSIQSIQINISFILRKLGKYKASLDTLHKIESLIPIAEEDDDAWVDLLTRYINTYLAMKDFKSGMPYFNKIVTLYNRQKLSPYFRQISRLAIAGYLQGMGKMKESKPYLVAYSEDVLNRDEPAIRLLQSHQFLYRADSAAGDIQGALEHYKLYKLFSDSITNLNKSRQLAVLQIQFETNKKDQDIQLLRQKSALQEASLQKEIIFRNVIFAGVCALLIILALTYNRSRLKQRNNLQLQQKQEEINDQNELLLKLLQEKEWLLKEIHHRVKNNLQIVISLLNSQSNYLDNQDAIDAIRNSQHRMHAMSLIHQKLYQTDNLARIDMSWYIRELVAYMQESFPTKAQIQFNLDITSLELDVAQAVPLGLVLNESVSNAIKYAFPGTRQGIIEISLKNIDEQHWQLRIFDNGTGLPEQFNIDNTSSLGMNLMRGLSEQLDGTFEVTSEQGTVITIVFPVAQKEMI
ncbi:histidine kinase dimerization/phosphoacceptor domain -containing protein [Chitinophaga sancti]|uniref:histidine kinase dimerization/phosphoacceptor domain -containing protein n=1 Tax=Chitinophaga sancti TaxID=1004 RepID=UPI002A752C41|nr:histidine kinase dimerization/phosphoacceptor domain -containing protein [Chitinophaga sancti]WPQ64772.1 histidine kinase dimerization/phosphoacceptor domain -containing protein [Chitinophaga sancti]